jgi:hypothetical protein
MRHDGKSIPEAIKRLIEVFVARSTERSTVDELYLMAGDSVSWKQAYELFERIRRRSLEANRHGDAKLEAQLGFEEACAKTLYNLSGEPAPFDADSPYWIIPNALSAARQFQVHESEVIEDVT